MSTVTMRPGTRRDLLYPLVAASVGAATFAATMTAGAVFDLNADSPDASGQSAAGLALYAGFLLGAGILAVWLGTRALAASPERVAGTALGLVIASVVTYVGFWSGWPHIFSAVGIALALEYRRRVGSLQEALPPPSSSASSPSSPPPQSA